MTLLWNTEQTKFSLFEIVKFEEEMWLYLRRSISLICIQRERIYLFVSRISSVLACIHPYIYDCPLGIFHWSTESYKVSTRMWDSTTVELYLSIIHYYYYYYQYCHCSHSHSAIRDYLIVYKSNCLQSQTRSWFIFNCCSLRMRRRKHSFSLIIFPLAISFCFLFQQIVHALVNRTSAAICDGNLCPSCCAVDRHDTT